MPRRVGQRPTTPASGAGVGHLEPAAGLEDEDDADGVWQRFLATLAEDDKDLFATPSLCVVCGARPEEAGEAKRFRRCKRCKNKDYCSGVI